MEEKVVKCNKCEKYFGHTEKDTKCPFCHSEYVIVEEKSGEKPKAKKLIMKTQKESFKIWGDN